jgi:hypothetical protein
LKYVPHLGHFTNPSLPDFVHPAKTTIVTTSSRKKTNPFVIVIPPAERRSCYDQHLEDLVG